MATRYVWSGAVGAGTGADWANAYTTMAAVTAIDTAGDTIFVAHDHAESTAANITLAFAGTITNPSKVICVNRAGSVPPVSADRRTTAQVITTTLAAISFTGCVHIDGIIFSAGTGASGANIAIPSSSGTTWLRFDNCSLRLGTTGATARITLGNGTADGALVEWTNTTVLFGAIGQAIISNIPLIWRDTPAALVGATIPTILFSPSAGHGTTVDCIGVDLSAAGSGKTIVGAQSTASAQRYTFVDCKLDAAVTKSAVPTSHGSAVVDFIRCAATGNYAVHRHRISGLLTEELTIVRTGGASDGTTPISWKIVTTANCNYSMPFECPPIARWNDVDGSPVTATVEGIWGGGAVPLDDEVWLEVEYLGDNSSPMGSFTNDGKANLLATAANQTSSSETWGGSTTKFKLAVTFTPQQPGWIYARVRCAKASSTFYIDPLVTLS